MHLVCQSSRCLSTSWFAMLHMRFKVEQRWHTLLQRTARLLDLFSSTIKYVIGSWLLKAGLASRVLFLIHTHTTIWNLLWSCKSLSLQWRLNGRNIKMMPTVSIWQLPSFLTFHRSEYWTYLREALILLDAFSLYSLCLILWSYFTHGYQLKWTIYIFNLFTRPWLSGLIQLPPHEKLQNSHRGSY